MRLELESSQKAERLVPPARRCAATKQQANPQKEAKVVPSAIVRRLVDGNTVDEQAADKRRQDEQAVEQSVPEVIVAGGGGVRDHGVGVPEEAADIGRQQKNR